MLCLLPEVTPLGAVHPTWTSRSDGFLVKDDTDILIAGAGPAGCVAGMLLARQGFRVVILEKRTPPFRKICGDLIGPRSLWYLKELPVAWDSKGWEGNPVRSLQVYDEKRMRSWAPLPGKSTGPGTAEAVSRILLDGYLREQAEAAGCTIRYGSNFRAVVERRGHRVICSVTEKKKERLWMTPVLLGADGARSAVARHVPQDLSRARPSGHVVAARGYFGNVKGLRDSVELYFLSRYLPGYAWVIPLGNGVANVGLGLRADACRRKGLRPVQEVYRFLQSHPVLAGRMRGAVPQEEVRGWVVGAGGQRASQFCGERDSPGRCRGSGESALRRGDFQRHAQCGHGCAVRERSLQPGRFLGSLVCRL